MSAMKKLVLETVRSRLATTFIRSSNPRSPVAHLLASNGIPTDAERKLIYEAITDVEARITQLEQEQEALEDVESADTTRNLKRLAKQRAVCEEFLRVHKALLVPIRHFPPEILQEIFLLYAETSTGYHRWVQLPFVLGQICRSWRAAAIKLPGLWDKLPCFKLSSSTKAPSYIAFLSGILRRSGKAETLRVYVRAPFKELTSHPVIALLVRHSHRIQSLTIESGYTTINAFGAMKGKLPNLQHLELMFWTHLTEGTVNVFENAPRLTKVTVMGRCPTELVLPWPQLTEFKERYDGGALRKALEHGADTLESLEVVKNTHHDAPAIPATTLASLKSLAIRLDDPSDIAGAFIENFTLPAIENIRVAFGGPVVPHLNTMLARVPKSQTTLRSLAFRSTGRLDSRELKTLFSNIPRLSELDLEVTEGDERFLDLFVDLTTDPLILPLLQTLSIHLRSTAGMEDLLNSVAGARCERTPDSDSDIANGVSELDFALLDRVRPLQTFRINLLSRDQRHKSQASLNKWKAAATSRQYRDTARLETFRKEIISLYPDFFAEPSFGSVTPSSAKNAKFKFPAKWDSIYKEIESFAGHDSVSLRASKLHLALHTIAKASPRYLKNDTKNYIGRAKDVLQQWNPIFSHHLHEYRWAMIGRTSLVYVPTNSPIRLSDQAVEDLAYGLTDEKLHSDVFWSNYI